MVIRLSLVFALSVLFLFPALASSATLGAAANAMCKTGLNYSCACGTKCGKTVGGKDCPCSESVSVGLGQGKVVGVCVAANKCEGKTYSGQDGASTGVGSSGAFNEILKGAMGLLQGLLQAKQQQPPPPPPPPPGSTGCTSYYQVTAPSSDPCATYVPPVDSLLGSGTNTDASGALLDALGGGDSLNISDDLLGALDGTTGAGSSTTSTNDLGSQAVNLQAGTRGDIQLGPSRATVVATARDTGANTEIAGFYGAGGSGQPQSLAERMCKTRPWAGTAVSYIIPANFFDSLCASRGYQVGSPIPTPKPAPAVKPPPPPPVATTTSPAPTPPSAPTVPPEVDIWAVPATVSLGSRTTVFWNTKGVDSCIITSPDGSFNEKTLSGGAATVPLSGATTFSISCLTPSGAPATDYVTVNMAI